MSSSIHGQSTDQPVASPRINDTDSKHEVADEIEKHGGDEEEIEDEEEEDEDFDFNPFLKGTPSPEASSSLSSEVEVLDGNSSKITEDEVRNYPVGDSEHGEEVVMQGPVDRDCEAKQADSASQLERGNVEEGENGFNKASADSDNEDAIWKRTRARYSLASFTLDELETFLQETDDEDDLQNVDDEEEYRKFLAAVLQGGDADGQQAQGVENGDDEDEDNDADFEIELEELLESDGDDRKRDEEKRVYERSLRRPETRQNRRQKASDQYKKKLLEQTRRPLRPLLPIFPNAAVAPIPSVDGKALMPEIAPIYPSSTEYLASGFSPQQIGQLHCLIHEHVQLLIQVFSLCVLDPSKQQVASQVQGLIFEMLHKREEGISCRNVPYPSVCFHSSYMSPSVTDEVSSFNPHCTESSSTTNTNRENVSQTAGSSWVPSISGPVISILDVAPLNLVGKYMDDVYNAVGEHRKRHVNSSCDTWNDKEPLFHLSNFPLLPEANGEVSQGNVPCKPSQPPPKKTLAASIVENVKKQSIAFVPKDISELIQRFQPLFNPAFFPHKPPAAAVANRILFTDSEDELLALGMMEYNTDWKAIQQRFLPCKSKHQIFVRQKNRCSSKALENPIKTVRRMKTSPLTVEEVECIQEGLRVFKHDWMSIWRFVVPHRDPSLLPRQWRTAIGTQKSYKSDAARKEKRRIYESNRRRCKTADLANWQLDNRFDNAGGENNSGDDYIDNGNDTYVHQAFLADWRPDSLGLTSEHSKSLPGGAMPSEQSQNVNMHGLLYARYCQYPNPMPQFSNARLSPYPINQVSGTTVNAAKSQYSWPYSTRRTDGAHMVKLAPDLPPVNLPPTVRVISQAAFRNNQGGAPKKFSSPGSGTSGCGKENTGQNLEFTSLAKTAENRSANSCHEEVMPLEQEDSAVVHDPCGTEERGTHSDLQMHPLLFQAPEDGRPSYYSFFSANQPQLNLSLFHTPYQANQLVECSNKSPKTKESASASCGIDFHPLLQRTDEENSDFCSRGSQNPSGAAQIKSPLNTSSKSSGPSEKVNDLDLEMHLSSSSAKEKSRGNEDASATNRSMSTSENRKTSSPCHRHTERRPTVQSNVFSGGDVSEPPSNDDIICNMDFIGDVSQPGIVMEQEELSDSDEETEEHVEFECEEMADSDGEEGWDCETTAQVQDKDPPSGEQFELMRLDGSSNSWLSLDSRGPIDPPRSKKYEERGISVSPGAKNLAAGRNRSSRKVTPSTVKRVATEDMAQQLSLGPLSVSTLKKPRKRICRANTGLSTEIKTENSRCDQD